MVETIFSEPIFVEIILPFLLVFTLVFAILDKSKLLGEGKRQINAIIALVVGLIFIGFELATNIVTKLIPFLAVSLVIIFVFMLIYGFISGKKDGDVLNKGLKIALGLIFGVAVIVAVLWSTGYWDSVVNMFVGGDSSSGVWINILLLLIIGGAIAAVLASGKKGSE